MSGGEEQAHEGLLGGTQRKNQLERMGSGDALPLEAALTPTLEKLRMTAAGRDSRRMSCGISSRSAFGADQRRRGWPSLSG